MDLTTYMQTDGVGLAELVQKREVTPAELLELSFTRLQQVNPELNAFTKTRHPQAVTEAAYLPDGPFMGVPIALKNISQALKGEALTSGSKLLASALSDRDSNFVARLRAAGVSFIGHTNTPEFGLKNITEPASHGASRNPWNPDYSPGGSSGGSAAAVASGIVPVAGASDGGGSIRIPASFTGLFGLKPTRGRTPVGPGTGRQWQGASIDFALTRTVRDSAALLDVLQTIQPEAAFQVPLFAGSYLETLKQAPKSLTVAFSLESPVGTPVSAEAKEAVRKTVKWLERQGHRVEEEGNGVDGIRLMQDYYIMNSGEMALVVRQLGQMLGRPLTKDDLEIEGWLMAEAGKNVSAADYSASIASWDRAAAKMADLHQTYDLYITPATASAAPKVGDLTHSEESRAMLLARLARAKTWQEEQALIYDMFLPSLTCTPFTQLANLTGQPAVSVPVHVTAAGLPIGVQLMANKGNEALLLQTAAAIEQSDLWIGMAGNPNFAN
ncbi:amidase family protein [Planococcus lenghuensis]|uniref:Amidase n=1 Tax=Planococcus lenghuensis TaxID=2213202 RepID=A0A1Q2L1T9_9BACL|nr:amidase family protein [Planococcus lenghuensis]AQQ54007.1 amidase [Planococcus lenghuensis]